MDTQDIITTLVAADGNINLAAERLNRRSDLGERLNEYTIKEKIVSDPNSVDILSRQLRGLLVLKLFDDLMISQQAMLSNIDEMKPSDVARLYASQLSAFTQLTSPSTKDTFDFEGEVMKTAMELGVPVDEVREDLKRLRANKSEAKSTGR